MFIVALVATLAAYGVHAGVVIANTAQGSGSPGEVGYEAAAPVLSNNIYFTPQYMPAFPTAATIWPRVVEVPCTESDGHLQCAGYEWSPKLGRGEYLFFKPVVVKAPPVVTEIVPVFVSEPTFTPIPEQSILKKIPNKKKKHVPVAKCLTPTGK
jgi:hypothetical protein